MRLFRTRTPLIASTLASLCNANLCGALPIGMLPLPPHSQALRKVGVAGVEALEALYDGLADAARVVLAHTHVATTRVVEHKYGVQAAQVGGRRQRPWGLCCMQRQGR